MTLTEFLLARIAEDEAVARGALNGGDGVWSAGTSNYDACRIEGGHIIIYDEGGHTPEQARFIAAHDPARVLAECEAKRRIAIREQNRIRWHEERGEEWAYSYAVVDLAAVYAGHPDYDEAWRP